jgi:hypothetical protein
MSAMFSPKSPPPLPTAPAQVDATQAGNEERRRITANKTKTLLTSTGAMAAPEIMRKTLLGQ